MKYSHRARATPLSLILLLTMGITWGLQVSLLKVAVEDGYNEINVMFVTLSLVTLAYSIVLVLRKQLFRLTRKRIEFLAVAALLGYLLPLAATLYAASRLPAGIIVLLVSLSPICTFAAAFLFKTESLSRFRVAAMLVGCLSAAIVMLPDVNPNSTLPVFWLIVALIVPICYGIESVYIDAFWPDNLNVLQIGMGEAAMATIMTIPFLIFFGEAESISFSWGKAEAAILIFVICGIFEVFLYFYLIQTTGGVLVSFATFISLFAGIAWGIIIFDEKIGATAWTAVVVLVFALILVSLDALRQEKAD